MKATRRSEQQERVRKQAAANLMKKRGGWMAAFGGYMEAALNGVARSVDASMDEDDRTPKVQSTILLTGGMFKSPQDQENVQRNLPPSHAGLYDVRLSVKLLRKVRRERALCAGWQEEKACASCTSRRLQ